MKKKKTENRVYVGLRMQSAIFERLEAIAKAQESSVRSVIEQLAKKGLPEMEKYYAGQ